MGQLRLFSSLLAHERFAFRAALPFGAPSAVGAASPFGRVVC